VGSAAQLAPYRAVAGALKLGYAQFEELEAFSRFGTRLDEHTRQVIQHGERIRACLKQPQFAAVPVLEQIALLQALTSERLDAIPLEQMDAVEKALHAAVAAIPEDIRQRCIKPGKPSPSDSATLSRTIATALSAF
jgi:F-type H+-transporting ATPase subunit alpha